MSQNSCNLSIPIAETQGGTGKTSFTKGQILTGNAAGGLSALNPPSDGQYLVADSTQTAGYKGQTLNTTQPGYHSVAPPKWQNTRQVTIANYAVADDTGAVTLSNTGSTTLDVSQIGGAGGHMVSAGLPGTIQVNKNYISGLNTTFTTTFAVGDIIYLSDFKQSRKITTIYNDTELLTDSTDPYCYRDWYAFGSAALSTTQAKFGGSSLYTSSAANYAQVQSYESSSTLHSGEFTIEFFFYPTSFSSLATIISSLAGDNRICINTTTSGNISYNISSNTTSWDVANGISGTRAITLNAWNHIAITYYLGSYIAYLNGGVDLSISTASLICADGLLTHRLGYNQSSTAQPFTGYFDEYRVSSCARYTGAFTPPTAAFTSDVYTISLNHFDGPNGSQLLSASEVNKPTPVHWDINQYGNPTISTTQKKFGGTSYYPAGNSGVVLNTGYSYGFAPTNYCLEFWVYPLNASATYVLFDSFQSTYYCSVNIQTSGKLNLVVGNNGTSGNIVSTTGTQSVNTNTWTHVALTYDGSTYRTFVNGVADISVASTTQAPSTWAKSIMIGGNQAKNNSFQGYMDEFRFSNIARYTAAFTPATLPFTMDGNTVSLNHFESGNTSQFFQTGEVANAGLLYQRGGLARQTHYYPYIVGSSTTSQIMLSPRCRSFGETVVDLPSGMTYIRQLKFACLINVRGNLPKFLLSGGFVTYPHIQDNSQYGFSFSSDYAVLAGGQATAFNTLSTATLIPKIAQVAFLSCYTYNDTANQVQLKVRPTGDNSLFNGTTVNAVSSTTNTAYNMGNFNDTLVPMNTIGQFDYKLTQSGGSINCGFSVRGYQITEV